VERALTHSGTVVSGTAESGGRQRRSQAAANRNRIIEAAITAFAADPDASMDDVAKAAGVVRRTVYAYFDSREALINGIVDEPASRPSARIWRLPYWHCCHGRSVIASGCCSALLAKSWGSSGFSI
jgi:AcrR family transcriptional regulator